MKIGIHAFSLPNKIPDGSLSCHSLFTNACSANDQEVVIYLFRDLATLDSMSALMKDSSLTIGFSMK